jgi:hypothetical protein
MQWYQHIAPTWLVFHRRIYIPWSNCPLAGIQELICFVVYGCCDCSSVFWHSTIWEHVRPRIQILLQNTAGFSGWSQPANDGVTRTWQHLLPRIRHLVRWKRTCFQQYRHWILASVSTSTFLLPAQRSHRKRDYSSESSCNIPVIRMNQAWEVWEILVMQAQHLESVPVVTTWPSDLLPKIDFAHLQTFGLWTLHINPQKVWFSMPGRKHDESYT